MAAAAVVTALALASLLGAAFLSGHQSGRRLRDAAAPAQSNVTAAAQAASDGATAEWMCSNRCYKQFGFTDNDCTCSNRGLWYMWICTSRYGSPIDTQFCGMSSCGGCSYAPAPATPPYPEPEPDPTPSPPPSHDGCSDAFDSCAHSRCCSTPGYHCFAKNDYWAQCRESCHPGIHHEEPRPFWANWTCAVLHPGIFPPAPIPSPVPPGASTAAPPAVAPGQDGYEPQDEALLEPSTAPMHTFYMYRVQNDQDYPPENQNTANLAGALWYLHNEIVINAGQRRFYKTRIQRFKVSTRATQPLADAGLNFGVRYAFDAGICTGPFTCQPQFERYGYFVGCNLVNDWPTQQWATQNLYPNATWYSLPGKCSTMRYNQHTDECELAQPGGACMEPTGKGNCTYSYEAAGEISINDLEGIGDFKEFAASGGWEYNNKTDRGVLMSFWNEKYNTTACERRLRRARVLFKVKYPHMPSDEELPEPPCDFDFDRFYSWALPPP